MSTHKNIIWRPDMQDNAVDENGNMFANVHLLVGYNQCSIDDFKKMAKELRKTFPQATDKEICGGKVHKSGTVYGFTIITWNAYIPKKEYEGWREMTRPDYYW
jgi:hypothetical protein